LQGRDVDWNDAQPKLLVSQEAAKQYWPGQSAIGKRIACGPRDTLGLEVVGVVADSRSRGLTTDVPPMIYMAYAGATRVARSMTLLVRGRGDAGAVLATTKSAIREIDPTLAVFNVQTVDDIIQQFV